jgi:hypothetical protein
LPKLRFLYALGAALVATVALAAPEAVLADDGEDEIVTTISLKRFKQAYGLYSVRQLIDPDPDDGVSFKLNKVDNDGNRIIWRDPNRNAVNVGKSFILFTVKTGTTSRSSFDLDATMDLLGRETRGGALAPVSCGLSGSDSSGVDSVTCGDGPSVSPS